ncbi:MAG: MFS transporter [Bacteroidia bacterium]|nr:MFS transporter [Bacteroidia bacterium]
MTVVINKTSRDSAAMRWLVLILISGLTFSTYWFQDFMSGLKGIMESEMGFSSEEFGRIIGLTTIANMLGMILVGGFILDKWGIRLTGYVFGILATIGAATTALAAAGFFGHDKSTIITMMIIGRIMFGSGLEILCVLATRTIVKWFKGYEMALAMAINIGFGRLGTALGMASSLDIGGGHFSPAVTFAATLIALSFLMFIIYTFFDVRIDRQAKGHILPGTAPAEDEEFRFSDFVKLITDKSFIYITLLCVTFYAAVFPFIQYAPDMLINKFGFTSKLPAAGSVMIFGSETMGIVGVYLILFVFALAFSIVPSRIKDLTIRRAFTFTLVTVFAIIIYNFWDILQVWLHNGSKTASLIPLGTIVFTPIFGNIVDKKGKAASLMMLGSCLLIFAHLSLSLSNSITLGYAALVSLGIAFALVPAAMWPSVAKIVPEKRLGTAYATMFTVQNWGLGAFFWGLGAVLDLTNHDKLTAIRAGKEVYDYTIPIMMLVVCGVISIFLAALLKKADKKQGYGLEFPSSSKH